MTVNGREPSAARDHSRNFDKSYWEDHWAGVTAGRHSPTANPHLASETAHLVPGRALDAGCRTGTEAIWLAEHGWQVTGVDISGAALTAADTRARRSRVADRVEWVQADLVTWRPVQRWDLVVTSYAHASLPQLDLYRRLSRWVAPGGTLVIVAHLDNPTEPHHPHETAVTPLSVTELFADPPWVVQRAGAHTRTVTTSAGVIELDDVVVRVHRTA